MKLSVHYDILSIRTKSLYFSLYHTDVVHQSWVWRHVLFFLQHLDSNSRKKWRTDQIYSHLKWKVLQTFTILTCVCCCVDSCIIFCRSPQQNRKQHGFHRAGTVFGNSLDSYTMTGIILRLCFNLWHMFTKWDYSLCLCPWLFDQLPFHHSHWPGLIISGKYPSHLNHCCWTDTHRPFIKEELCVYTVRAVISIIRL